MIKHIVIFLVVLSVVFVLPSQSFALSCAIPPFDEAFKKHDLLLHGKLVEKTTPPLVTKETTLVFDTINVYKGESQNQFTVNADLSWDDHYREGEEYILFADKREDHYFKDLCVGTYIATNDIIKFLDNYVAGKTTGDNVKVLYDVVSIFEMNQLESKMDLYTKINRGNVLLNSLINDNTEHDYSCNFEEDLKQAEKLFAENVYVFNKLRDASNDYTITTDATLSTNPQTGLVVIESAKHKATISILNSPHFENCFFVYNQKLIDKATGELDVHRDSLERMCDAEDATAILPDLCKPLNTFEINDILYIVVPLVVFGGIAFIVIIYKRKK